MSARLDASRYEVRRAGSIRAVRPSRWVPSICWPRRRYAR